MHIDLFGRQNVSVIALMVQRFEWLGAFVVELSTSKELDHLPCSVTTLNGRQADGGTHLKKIRQLGPLLMDWHVVVLIE